VIAVSKQWLQDILTRIIGQAGNFEVIVFGIAMIIVLQRARDGLWPVLTRWVPVRRRPRRIDPGVPPLVRQPLPAAGETVLEVEGATRRFGGLVAVNEMNLRVRAGEIVALIGPNGAGKSTMFNLISGVLLPTSGEVRFRGRPIAGQTSREISRLGMSRTFQHVKLLPAMSVIDNVAIGAHRREYPGLFKGVITGAWRLDRREEARVMARRRGRSSASAWPTTCSRPPVRCRSASSGSSRSPCAVRRPLPAAARRAGGRPALPGEAGAGRTAAQAEGRRRVDPAGRA